MIFNSFSTFTKIFFITIFIFQFGCSKNNSELDPNRPLSGKEKRKQNIEQGKGASLGSILGKARGGTNYEFSSSNPMWRASLETLDFLPLTTVDYSGGIIITDWYSDNSSINESIKITIRFLSNEIRSDSVKIIIHKKTCKNLNCVTSASPSNLIRDELRATILRKASLFEKDKK